MIDLKKINEKERIILSQCRILVTPTSYGKTDPRLKSDLEAAVGEVIYNPFPRPLKAAELITLIKEVDGYIAGLDEITGEVIQAADRLKVIARYGVGFDRVDLQAATLKKIILTNTPGANSAAVAEMTLTFILASARQLCQINEATKQGKWPRANGLGLLGKTIGFFGFGTVAQEAALRLQGFGCRLLAYDPYLEPTKGIAFGLELVSLDHLLSQADFLSLHAPLNPETSGIVNQTFLAKMKPGASLINTARGELIDEPALIEAIQDGRLRGAALDCFREEPPRNDHPLLAFPQVITTAHVSGQTDEAMSRMGWMALESCLEVLRGERPRHTINREVFE